MTLPPRRIRRRIPTWGAVAPLLGFRRPVWDRVDRRLAQAMTVKDLARIARRTTPRSVFDYVHGAAEDELSIARARRAFASVEFEPRVLHDVASVDTSTGDEIHVAAFKSYHTATPNGYNLQLSAVTHDTRLTLPNAVRPKPKS